ncbi:MAG: hypothetical protein GX287_05200 [Fusobacteria bacterium]|nr:hypothetical protein [Fusobacteriota bacterium]
MYFKKKDLILYFFLSLFFIFIFILIQNSNSEKTDIILIYKDGKLSHRYKLTKEKQEIEIDSDIIIIENFEVKKIKTSCHNKICMKHKITKQGGMIICVPQKTVIKLKENNNKYDYIIK